MDAFWSWLWGTGWFWFAMFWAALLVNGRAAFKLLLDWKGMLTTCRFVEHAYAHLDTLPDEATLERHPAAPVFVHLVPAWEEPEIATTLRALLDSRYPHTKLHVVVATRDEEESAPNPTMKASTTELLKPLLERHQAWPCFRVALGDRSYKADPPRSLRLRTHSKRPCCRAADQAEQLASSHMISLRKEDQLRWWTFWRP